LHRAVHQGQVNWILEADIESFFDSVNRTQLVEMLQKRVRDGSVRRLIGKCLHVGVLEGEEYSAPEEGTVQGSILSPLLANIYLHYVLDEWFERQIRPRLSGRAQLVRYADDFVLGFEREDDARRVLEVLGKRLDRFGLRLHPEKTRLLPFARPEPSHQGKGPGTFDFLGFTFFWMRSRRGRWVQRCKTRKARLSQAMSRVYDWCRRHRHQPVAEQHAALVRRLRGHLNYFGVSGNLRSYNRLLQHTRRAWFKWLCRRSQKARLTWERFSDLLKDFPLPTPRVVVPLWGVPP
jgi:RNA-directed DNA polymerase